MLFTTQPDLVWGLIASLYVGNVVLLLLNLPLVGLWVRLLSIPKRLPYAGIIVFAMLGTFGMRQSAFDLVLLWMIGLLGLGLRRFGYPLAPIVIGLILGPIAEGQLRRALSIGQGDASVLVGSPIAAVLLAVAAVVLLVRPVSALLRRSRTAAA